MRVLVAVLALLMLAVSGCISDDAPKKATDAGGSDTLYEDDRFKLENLTDEEQAPTLADPPKWKLGEWWRVKVTDLFVGAEHETVRVVAGGEDDNFLVGMPNHDFSNAIMVLHIPGFGQVAKSDLSFEIHDCPFKPLRFPLTLGDTWDTEFECRAVTAEVTEVTNTTATVEMIGANDLITLTYDAEQRQIVSWEKEGYARYEVVEHGEKFHEAFPTWEGLVTVPHMHDVIFQHGRIAAGAIAFGFPGVGPINSNPDPYDEVEVDPTYDRVSFTIILGNLWSLVNEVDEGPVGGMYRETATAPDGTAYALEMLPSENDEWKLGFYKHDDPDGTWTFEHIAAGPGLAMAEGIAYHVYDIELPSGNILPSVGEHQHGHDSDH